MVTETKFFRAQDLVCRDLPGHILLGLEEAQLLFFMAGIVITS